MTRYLLTLMFLASAANAATCNAASTSSTDVQAAVDACTGSGDTVVVPSGSSTWATTVNVSSKLGTSVTPYTIQGATTCPGAAGTPLAGPTPCTDNTVITDQGASGAALIITGFDATHFVRVTGFTWTESTAHGNGAIQINGTAGTLGFRMDHSHLIAGNGTGRGYYPQACCGLFDHIWADVTATSGSHQAISIDGTNEGNDGGWTPWGSATVFGGSACTFVEDSYFSVASADAGVEDQVDAYSGACVVVRHSNFLNSTVGFHGTDSGGQRGPYLIEVYNNTLTNNSGTTLSGGTMRGGTGVWHDQTYGGSGSWNPIKLQVFRTAACEPDNSSNWGVCDGHQNWVVGSTTHSAQAGRNNSNGSGDWQSGHAYAAFATIQPTSNNAGNWNYTNTAGSCTSGGGRPSFNQTVTSSAGTPTTSDNTCTWKNAGGGAAGSAIKFCAVNRDTQCSIDATCSAITGGDTCSTYFDGGTIGSLTACRDQVGRAHNQILTPVYAWNLSGGGVALAETCSSVLVSNTDFINNGTTSMPGYTPYTYPNPLAAGGVVPPTNLSVFVIH